MQNGVAMGNRHMGPLALLDFLELHLGLAYSATNKIERIFNYRKNLHDNTKGSFYEKALAINPGYASAHYNLASLQMTQGKLTDAIAHFAIA